MSEIRKDSREPPSWIAATFETRGTAKRLAAATGRRRAVRVLLVDDSDADRVRFARALANAGYEVYAAEDGSEAWERLQQHDFDVMVSDRQMPGTDGIELVRLVRANRKLERLPVIMVSALDAPLDREVGIAAGASDYICKSDERAAPVLLRSVERLTRARPVVRSNPLFERALVVDRSTVAQQLLARALRIHCRDVVCAASIPEARERLHAGSVSLVVLDAALDGALEWFAEHGAWESRPAFLIVTSHPSPAQETRASLLGAIGYLAKPISVRQLSHTLVSSTEDFEPTPARAHVVPLAEASIADPNTGEPQLSCPVLNLSAEGALLATTGPIEVGARLHLMLALAGRSIALRAKVVRVQAPGWGVTGGCGVVFEYDDDESRRAVESFVDAHTDLRTQPRFRTPRPAPR